MQIVEKALREIKLMIYIFDIGNLLLNTFIIFMIILIFTILFNFKWYFALLSLVYLIYFIIREIKKNKYYIVENKVRDLRERLTTVADNLYKTNPIVDSLKEDVVKDIKKIKTSYFIDYNTLTSRLIIFGSLTFIVILLAFLSVKFDFQGFKLPEVNIVTNRGFINQTENLKFSLSEGNLTDILGNKSIAELGKKELKLTINPLESDTNLNVIKQTQKEDFNSPDFPKEIYTRYDRSYQEKIAKENQKIVKDYFEKITR